jgi:hypothetical protein
MATDGGVRLGGRTYPSCSQGPPTTRIGWEKASGYNLRASVEADIGRWKRVIGEALHSQKAGRQATEVAIAVGVVNRMLGLGRPNYARII